MKLFVVTYDLRKPGQSYASLIEALKTATEWRHPMQSVWLLWSSRSAQEWHDIISKHADGNDYWLVTELAPERYGWLPREVWDWISAKLATV